MTLRRLQLLAIAVLAAGTAAARPPDVYGPPPDWTRYKALGEAAVRAKLPDPSKWTVEWPNGTMKGGWRHKGRFVGYLSCGVLRASEPVPGFHQRTQFVIVIDNDQVQTVDISDRHTNSLVNVMCDDMTRRGMLPPARIMEQPQDVTLASLGLTVRAMPEGAYVVAVAPGSAVATAGMTPGTVITRANGIALAGMGPAMTAVLGSDTPTLALATAAGAHLDVRRTP